MLGLLGGTPGPALAGAAQDAAEESAQALAAWVRRGSRLRRPFEESDVDRLAELVAGLPRVGEGLRLSAPALLDVMALGRDPERVDEALGPRHSVAIERLGRAPLDELLANPEDPAFLQWLSLSVLGNPREHSLDRRRAALRLLEGRRDPSLLLPLASVVREGEAELREAALEELLGWPDPFVHRFLLEGVQRGPEDERSIAIRTMREHFKRLPEGPTPGLTNPLFEHVSTELFGGDWRRASRALALADPLPTERIAPILIEALAFWLRRAGTEEGSRRVEHEITSALRERSGRSIGAHPDRWHLWWQAVQEGRITPQDGADGEDISRASFFGLRPVSDRVLFLIDRSGSMAMESGAPHTRFDRAVDEVLGFLRTSGERTQFDIILFNEGSARWKDRLLPATERNLEAASKWMRRLGPDGGTELTPAVQRAMRLDRQGVTDLRRLEADTVIVLCDGQVSRGFLSFLPDLLEANERAWLVFHCLQIGRGGDGVLESLAESTGGEFLNVQR